MRPPITLRLAYHRKPEPALSAKQSEMPGSNRPRSALPKHVGPLHRAAMKTLQKKMLGSGVASSIGSFLSKAAPYLVPLVLTGAQTVASIHERKEEAKSRAEESAREARQRREEATLEAQRLREEARIAREEAQYEAEEAAMEAERQREAEKERLAALRAQSGRPTGHSQAQAEAKAFVERMVNRYPSIFASVPSYRRQITTQALAAIIDPEGPEPDWTDKELSNIEYTIAEADDKLQSSTTYRGQPAGYYPGSTADLPRPAGRVERYRSAPTAPPRRAAPVRPGARKGRGRTGAGIIAVSRA